MLFQDEMGIRFWQLLPDGQPMMFQHVTIGCAMVKVENQADISICCQFYISFDCKDICKIESQSI